MARRGDVVHMQFDDGPLSGLAGIVTKVSDEGAILSVDFPGAGETAADEIERLKGTITDMRALMKVARIMLDRIYP